MNTLKNLYTILLTDDERNALYTELGVEVEHRSIDTLLSYPYMRIIDGLRDDETLHRWYNALIENAPEDRWNTEKHNYFKSWCFLLERQMENYNRSVVYQ